MAPEWKQLFVVKQHQLRMCARRGYVCPDAALLDYTFEQFETYYTRALEQTPDLDLTSALSTELETPRKALVWYTQMGTKEVSLDDVRALLDYVTEDDGTVRPYRDLLVVSPGPMRSKASLPLEALHRFKIRVQHFTYQELSYDPLHHFLANTHTRLSKDEANQVYASVGVQGTCFPTIYSTDPVVKHLGFKAGDLIRVERKGLQALGVPSSVFYRRVAPGPKH